MKGRLGAVVASWIYRRLHMDELLGGCPRCRAGECGEHRAMLGQKTDHPEDAGPIVVRR